MNFFEPATVDEAVAFLASNPGARCLAGGASLVAMMNADLVEPEGLISLRGISRLQDIEFKPGGGAIIGAMTRHKKVADAQGLSIVGLAAERIANPPVRNMGTIGGSISHADPGADYPAVLVAADAEIEIAGPDGIRRLPAQDFFTDWYETALAPDEMVIQIHLPPSPGGAVAHYEKLVRVEGDMGIAMVAVVMEADGRARIAVGGCGPTPVRLAEAEAPGANAGEILAAACDPPSDARASEAYRRRVVPRMVDAALAAAQAKLEAC